jgi:hypothetical protein
LDGRQRPALILRPDSVRATLPGSNSNSGCDR